MSVCVLSIRPSKNMRFSFFFHHNFSVISDVLSKNKELVGTHKLSSLQITITF